jgi:predicted O-methyltransferase YrrM
VITLEIAPAKVERALRSFAEAGLAETIELRQEDALWGLSRFSGNADLIFIDIEKDPYEGLLEPAVEALRPGGLLVADNLISSEAKLAGFRKTALSHPQLVAQVVPIGPGELVAVKSTAGLSRQG